MSMLPSEITLKFQEYLKLCKEERIKGIRFMMHVHELIKQGSTADATKEIILLFPDEAKEIMDSFGLHDPLFQGVPKK